MINLGLDARYAKYKKGFNQSSNNAMKVQILQKLFISRFRNHLVEKFVFKQFFKPCQTASLSYVCILTLVLF